MDDAAQATAQTLIKVEAKGLRGDSYLTRNDLKQGIERNKGLNNTSNTPHHDNKTSYRS